MFTTNLKHPYGVLPPGNQFIASPEDLLVRPKGLGRMKCIHDDELVLEILSFCSFKDLGALNCCSRAMYVYSMHNELWRDLVLRICKDNFCFENSWKDTFAKHVSNTNSIHRPIIVRGIYSHALYQSWLCRNLDLESACPGFFEFSNISRLESTDLSVERFVKEFEVPNKPVIIRGVVTSWPAYEKWDLDYLAKTCGSFQFRATSATAAGAATLTMSQYKRYSEQTIGEYNSVL